MSDTLISRLFGGKSKTDKSNSKDNDESKNKDTSKTETTHQQNRKPKMTLEFSDYLSYFEGPGAIHNQDLRWDAQNKPVEYILGASPGFAQFAQGDEKLTTTGLGRKIAKASRMGFDFAMIDFEALSEMYEPDLKELIDRIKTSQGNDHTGTHFEIGLHLPTDMDLCIANAFQWTQMQEKLIRGAYSAAALVKARFYLFHTSSNIRPHVTFTVGQQEPRVAQVSHDGINLGDFIQQVDNGTYTDSYTAINHGKITKTPDDNDWRTLEDWFKAKFISVLFNVMGAAGDPAIIGFLESQMIENKITGLESGKDKIKTDVTNMLANAWKGVQKREEEAITKDNDIILAEITEKNSIQQQIENEIAQRDKANAIIPHYLQKSYEDNRSFIEGKSNRLEINKRTLKHIKAAKQFEEALNLVTKDERTNPHIVNRLRNELDEELNGGAEHGHPNTNPTDTYKKFSEKSNMRATFEHYNFDTIFDFWKSHGSECEERVSYHVIAKYMWLTKDPFWTDIVGKKYDPDKILRQADIGKEWYDEEDRQKNITILVNNLITAVASKYIQGHLYTTHPKNNMLSLPEQRIINHVKKVKNAVAGQQDCEKATSVYWYTRFNKIQIYIETAMPPQGQEGQLRIMNANDHVRLAKHLDGGKYISYTMDFEHLMDNFIDPGTDIQTLADGDAKYITMLHVNAPRPVMGAHAPLDTISNDQILLYRWIYALKQKGMNDAYIIWEMGSYGSRDSATAFRRLINCLRKNTHPDNLPTSFFGIDETFEAQQHVAIQEHAYDPLEGVLMIPEESHTLLGSAAKDKGKLAEWAREQFR